MPAEIEMTSPIAAMRAMSVIRQKYNTMVEEEVVCEHDDLSSGVAASDGTVLFDKPHGLCDDDCSEDRGNEQEMSVGEVEQWDLFMPLGEGSPESVPKVLLASCDGLPVAAKTEVTYTKGIEELLSSLEGPLTIVHNVDPSEVSASFSKWEQAAIKEIKSFESASKKVMSTDKEVIKDLRSGRAKLVPMKGVYTVKPSSAEAVEKGEWFRRKVRIVACGNMMAESGEDTYAAAAPAEVVRSSLSVSSKMNWDAAVLDVTAAFLQTPLCEVQCKQRILGQPPRALVRAGLCHEHELWDFTHAVYGLRESPRWWGEFRDSRLAQLNVVVGTRRIKLTQCRVESSWWKLVEDSVLVGLVVVYVDDLLICSIPSIITAVAEAINRLWDTSVLSWASKGGIRFLGIEIVKVDGGFALNQEPYIRELTRIHAISEKQLDLVPVSREQASFVAESSEAVFTVEELRQAQRLAGEILWVSQRTRPDIAFTSSLISSLSARAPRRASAIAKKCIGFLQRTSQQHLWIRAKSNQLIAWTDASYAPDGSRSHSGWVIALDEAPINWRSARQSTVTLSTAESELSASTEGALALISAEALLSELNIGPWELRLRTDSTSSAAIQRGSGSWRTRHLRIKSSWITEKLEAGDLEIEHWPGDDQLADALTKPLSSIRMRHLAGLIGLMSLEEIAEKIKAAQDNNNCGSTGAIASELVVYQPMTVDHGLVMWCVFAIIALLWTAAWELIKYAGWQMYFSITPGASARRMRRLRRIRDATTEAIQSEITARRRELNAEGRTAPEVMRARDAEVFFSSSSARDRSASLSRVPDAPLQTTKTVYGSNQRDKAVQTTGPAFTPVLPEVRTEVRREIQIPENVYIGRKKEFKLYAFVSIAFDIADETHNTLLRVLTADDQVCPSELLEEE
ncbi:unnamed protein product [Symbiodinium sp. CCMP2456]|nr:unnamed protein product [Symbiodinium sp. CCMP2456]